MKKFDPLNFHLFIILNLSPIWGHFKSFWALIGLCWLLNQVEQLLQGLLIYTNSFCFLSISIILLFHVDLLICEWMSDGLSEKVTPIETTTSKNLLIKTEGVPRLISILWFFDALAWLPWTSVIYICWCWLASTEAESPSTLCILYPWISI